MASEKQVLKLTYFGIEGAAEKIRLALKVNGVEFEDERVKGNDWKALANQRFGQLPLLTITDEDKSQQVFAQSDAILRYVATLGDGLYHPLTNALMMLKIDEVCGLMSDLSRDWTPCLYLNMGTRHMKYGYPEEWPAKADTVKALRERFMETYFATHMNSLSKLLDAHEGKFLFGEKLTIADLDVFTHIRPYTRGFIDHVDKNCLEKYPKVLAYYKEVANVDAIAKWYN